MAAVAEKLFEIQVTFNGISEPLKVNAHEQVQAVLARALNTFDIQQDRERYRLFTADNRELDPHQSVQQAGIAEGALLALRPRSAGGG
jgi:hypothetical protein